MIIDTLFGTLSDFGFTADNTAVQQDIVDGGAGDPQFFPVTTIQKYLQAQDNFTILSVMLACPHNYVVGDDFPRFDLGLKKSGGLTYPLAEYGSNGLGIRLPALNQWVDLNISVTFRNYFTAGKGILVFGDIIGRVSQAGMPAVLNGTAIKVIPALKIAHTLPMVA